MAVQILMTRPRVTFSIGLLDSFKAPCSGTQWKPLT